MVECFTKNNTRYFLKIYFLPWVWVIKKRPMNLNVLARYI